MEGNHSKLWRGLGSSPHNLSNCVMYVTVLCKIIKVVLWSKNHFLFFFRFLKRVRLKPKWQNFELWVLSESCLFWVQVLDFTARHYSRSKLTDSTLGGWIWRKWRHLLTTELKISVCKRSRRGIGSRRGFGRRDFSSRRESRRETKFPAAKISPGSCRESRQDSRREAKIPAAKISPGSCRGSRQDSRREEKIPAAKISAPSCRESY